MLEKAADYFIARKRRKIGAVLQCLNKIVDLIFRILGNLFLSSFFAAKCHRNHLCMMFGFVKDYIPNYCCLLLQ